MRIYDSEFFIDKEEAQRCRRKHKGTILQTWALEPETGAPINGYLVKWIRPQDRDKLAQAQKLQRNFD